MMKLDLGGTACFEDEHAVSISLDGSSSDDEVTPVLIGDYNFAPFANDSFDEAFGCCYFEDQFDFEELFRIMKPGSEAKLSSCSQFAYPNSSVHEDSIPGFEELLQQVAFIAIVAAAAGFSVRVEDRGGDAVEELIDHPWFILKKEKESNR